MAAPVPVIGNEQQLVLEVDGDAVRVFELRPVPDQLADGLVVSLGVLWEDHDRVVVLDGQVDFLRVLIHGNPNVPCGV